MRLMKIVFASSNKGKLKEAKSLLGNFGVELVSQSELGILPCDEPHITFVENSLEKARHAAKLSGLPALAEDSGICVPELDGRPGIKSARYSGDQATDEGNVKLLLRTMAATSNRSAFYHCSLALMRHSTDPSPLISEGRWHGQVLYEPRGDGGFGYDPIFFDPQMNLTGAEMTLEQKNSVSHRGHALRTMMAMIRENF